MIVPQSQESSRPKFTRRLPLADGARRGGARGFRIGLTLATIVVVFVVLGSIVTWLLASGPDRSMGPLGLAAYLLLYNWSGVRALAALVSYASLLGAVIGGLRGVLRGRRTA